MRGNDPDESMTLSSNSFMNNHPETFRFVHKQPRVNVNTRQTGLMVGEDPIDKVYQFNRFNPLFPRMPSLRGDMLNPSWNPNPNRFGGSLVNTEMMVYGHGNVLPFSNDSLEEIWAGSLDENRRLAIHNPLSNTYALNQVDAATLSQTLSLQQKNVHNPFIYTNVQPTVTSTPLAATNTSLSLGRPASSTDFYSSIGGGGAYSGGGAPFSRGRIHRHHGGGGGGGGGEGGGGGGSSAEAKPVSRGGKIEDPLRGRPAKIPSPLNFDAYVGPPPLIRLSDSTPSDTALMDIFDPTPPPRPHPKVHVPVATRHHHHGRVPSDRELINLFDTPPAARPHGRVPSNAELIDLMETVPRVPAKKTPSQISQEPTAPPGASSHAPPPPRYAHHHSAFIPISTLTPIPEESDLGESTGIADHYSPEETSVSEEVQAPFNVAAQNPDIPSSESKEANEESKFEVPRGIITMSTLSDSYTTLPENESEEEESTPGYTPAVNIPTKPKKKKQPYDQDKQDAYRQENINESAAEYGKFRDTVSTASQKQRKESLKRTTKTPPPSEPFTVQSTTIPGPMEITKQKPKKVYNQAREDELMAETRRLSAAEHNHERREEETLNFSQEKTQIRSRKTPPLSRNIEIGESSTMETMENSADAATGEAPMAVETFLETKEELIRIGRRIVKSKHGKVTPTDEITKDRRSNETYAESIKKVQDLLSYSREIKNNPNAKRALNAYLVHLQNKAKEGRPREERKARKGK